jgi:hypothetical protein
LLSSCIDYRYCFQVYRNDLIELLRDESVNVTYLMDALTARPGLLPVTSTSPASAAATSASSAAAVMSTDKNLRGESPSANNASSSSGSGAPVAVAVTTATTVMDESARKEAVANLKSIFSNYGEGFLMACLLVRQ